MKLGTGFNGIIFYFFIFNTQKWRRVSIITCFYVIKIINFDYQDLFYLRLKPPVGVTLLVCRVNTQFYWFYLGSHQNLVYTYLDAVLWHGLGFISSRLSISQKTAYWGLIWNDSLHASVLEDYRLNVLYVKVCFFMAKQLLNSCFKWYFRHF